MDEIIREFPGTYDFGKDWRFLQYTGRQAGSVGMGSAMIDGRPSYILDISGETADDLYDLLTVSSMKMTRLDLQITVPKPADWDTVEFHFLMELGDWPKNVKRDVQTRLNKGNDTIYIGDRTSGRYIRVYVKDVDYVRFEVEFKKEQAAKAWQMVKSGRRYAIAGILMAEIQSLPYAPIFEPMMNALKVHADMKIKVPAERKKTVDITRLKWLASLLPTIEGMMNDSDYGHMVTGWFLDLVDKKMMQGGIDETEN